MWVDQRGGRITRTAHVNLLHAHYTSPSPRPSHSCSQHRLSVTCLSSAVRSRHSPPAARRRAIHHTHTLPSLPNRHATPPWAAPSHAQTSGRHPSQTAAPRRSPPRRRRPLTPPRASSPLPRRWTPRTPASPRRSRAGRRARSTSSTSCASCLPSHRASSARSRARPPASRTQASRARDRVSTSRRVSPPSLRQSSRLTAKRPSLCACRRSSGGSGTAWRAPRPRRRPHPSRPRRARRWPRRQSRTSSPSAPAAGTGM